MAEPLGAQGVAGNDRSGAIFRGKNDPEMGERRRESLQSGKTIWNNISIYCETESYCLGTSFSVPPM